MNQNTMYFDHPIDALVYLALLQPDGTLAVQMNLYIDVVGYLSHLENGIEQLPDGWPYTIEEMEEALERASMGELSLALEDSRGRLERRFTVLSGEGLERYRRELAHERPGQIVELLRRSRERLMKMMAAASSGEGSEGDDPKMWNVPGGDWLSVISGGRDPSAPDLSAAGLELPRMASPGEETCSRNELLCRAYYLAWTAVLGQILGYGFFGGWVSDCRSEGEGTAPTALLLTPPEELSDDPAGQAWARAQLSAAGVSAAYSLPSESPEEVERRAMADATLLDEALQSYAALRGEEAGDDWVGARHQELHEWVLAHGADDFLEVLAREVAGALFHGLSLTREGYLRLLRGMLSEHRRVVLERLSRGDEIIRRFYRGRDPETEAEMARAELEAMEGGAE